MLFCSEFQGYVQNLKSLILNVCLIFCSFMILLVASSHERRQGWKFDSILWYTDRCTNEQTSFYFFGHDKRCARGGMREFQHPHKTIVCVGLPSPDFIFSGSHATGKFLCTLLDKIPRVKLLYKFIKYQNMNLLTHAHSDLK